MSTQYFNHNEKLWLALSQIKGVGPRHYQKIRLLFKSPADFLSASQGQLQKARLESIWAAFSRQKDKHWLQFSENLIQKHLEFGVQIIGLHSPLYPSRLRILPNPPPFIFLKGKPLKPSPTLAIVGTRRPSRSGLELARKFSSELTLFNWNIVSGLADGIDTAAHSACLHKAGHTIAVIGTGHNVFYPGYNRELQNQISAVGTVISEYPLGTAPAVHHFPARNRLVSALAWATLVVEAGYKSGALITAQLAQNLRIPLFSVPGSPLNSSSIGSNKLLQQGARIACSPLDVHGFFYKSKGSHAPTSGQQNVFIPKGGVLTSKEQALTSKEKVIFGKISKNTAISQLSANSDNTLGELIIILMSLETKGFIKRSAGSRYSTIQ